mgnify:CR=1 FL=1
MPAIPNANQIIAGWDGNGDGKIDQAELVSGLRQQANHLIATFDRDQKGYFTHDDVQSRLGSAPQAIDAQLQAGNIMALWDINKDGRVTLSEALAGLAAGQTPPAFADTTTTTA